MQAVANVQHKARCIAAVDGDTSRNCFLVGTVASRGGTDNSIKAFSVVVVKARF